MLGGTRGAVKATPMVLGAAMTSPLAAASARRFLRRLTADRRDEIGETHLSELQRQLLSRSAQAPEQVALTRLLAADVARLRARIEDATTELAPWVHPEEAAVTCFERLCSHLAQLGLDPGDVRLKVCEQLPGPYDHPRLWAVSLDAADARQWGESAGIFVRRSHVAPWVTPLTLGHVLVHAILGASSPHALGRGLEEGLAEVLGGLHVGAQIAGSEAIDAVFRALRLTPTASHARLEHLQAVRACARLHRRVGVDGLVRLVSDGRDAIKAAERRLQSEVPLAETRTVDHALDERLERLLTAPQPRSVPPLEYLVATELRPGATLQAAADRLALPHRIVEAAGRSLAERTYLAIIDDDGRVLAEDLQLVRSLGGLRYDPD